MRAELSLEWPDNLEQALRFAARAHRNQCRKTPGPSVPYVQHVVAVAWTLDRLGFELPVLLAALLHDTVEDTDVTLSELERRFGSTVASIVATCTERKVDSDGKKRPWIDRKLEALDTLAQASLEARAVALADKLHNLRSIRFDLGQGHDVWPTFNADRASVLWYYRQAADRWAHDDSRLDSLARACHEILDCLENHPDQ